MKSAAAKFAARTAASPPMTLARFCSTVLITNFAGVPPDQQSQCCWLPIASIRGCCQICFRQFRTILACPGDTQNQESAHFHCCRRLCAGKVDKKANPHQAHHCGIILEIGAMLPCCLQQFLAPPDRQTPKETR